MTPKSLYDTYRSLNVPLLDGRTIFGLDIHEYRNYYEKGDISTVDGMKAYEVLKDIVERKCTRVGPNQYRFVRRVEGAEGGGWIRTVLKTDIIDVDGELKRPYLGKGFPDDIRLALRLAVHYKILDATKAEIQKYCDKNIGLDCSGLATAYYGPTWIRRDAAAYRDLAPKVRTLADIRTGDAIVYKNGKHIALIDTITERSGTCVGCMVAESTADRMETGGPSDGLNYTEYFILFDGSQSGGQEKFKVLRSLVKKGEDIFYSPEIFVIRP